MGMEIKLNIQEPHDNTNTPHGTIAFSSDNKYTYINLEGKRITVSESDFYKMACALH